MTIVDAELRRVASAQGIFAREPPDTTWRSLNPRQLPSRLPGREPRPGTRASSPRHRAGGAAARRLLLAGHCRAHRPRQFEILTRPSSGVVVVQGSAGSGKTTIGLHRIAYLNFAQPTQFRPEEMLVIVYQRALAAYVSRVLPELDVPRVKVSTFAAWASEVRKQSLPGLACAVTDQTPSLVVRAKSHGAMLDILADRQAGLLRWARKKLETLVALEPGAGGLLETWDQAGGPVNQRVTTLARFVRESDLPELVRAKVEACGALLRARTRDVIGEWASLLTDRQALAQGFAQHAPGLFSPVSSTAFIAGAWSGRGSARARATQTMLMPSTSKMKPCSCVSTSCSAAP